MKSLFFVLLFCSACVSTSIAQNGVWTWMKGASTTNSPGNFGQQNIPSLTNEPPALYETTEWTDLNGNFWIFGGINSSGSLSTSLWKFDPVAGVWTWMNGPPTIQQPGAYGTQGVSAPTNYPGSRGYGCVSWTDSIGNLWLFGGYGLDINGNQGLLNDLWRYTIATNEWTWMKGSSTNSDPGNFGTLQVPAASNVPPAQSETAAGWVSNSGDLWLFGPGYGAMWRYSPTTNLWTWMSGSNTLGTPVNYGVQTVAAPTNTPGSREQVYAHWTDRQGQFWLFGGLEYDPALFTTNLRNDMWVYDPVTNLWTWMAGTSSANAATTFQTQCQYTTAAPDACFEDRACWTDACGRFWHYGGFTDPTGLTSLSQLWMFDPQRNEFNWISGPLAANQPGNYGLLQVPAATNLPNPSAGSVGFTDLNGDLWLFGGYVMGTSGFTNALWRYQPDPLCPMPSEPVSIDFSTLPADSGCVPLALQFVVDSISGYTYHWNFGDPSTSTDTSSGGAVSWTYSQPGTYTVTVIATGSGFCETGTDTASVVINAFAAPEVNLGDDVSICAGQTVELSAGQGALTYVWSTGATSPSIVVNSSGAYSVLVSDGRCETTDTILVRIDTGGVFVPINVFSPNGDGINDVFDLQTTSSANFQLSIYDRWGLLVFQTTDPTLKWSGDFQQQNVAEGVYYWTVQTEDCSGKPIEKNGFVHVLRQR